ncbi:uncharacterized protein DNG_10399 [Cephalotrichum gorgonifer]|uniref:Fe2OG dioxygenase domain-containing protein n=1 Tax=Cephalotrichum gorgonifer TaxID=2041049 RepID=A0AAE8N8B6_9PEZI|nr:uncharacterized protein DNG_10399 [Cephalotrichum gorgonifer]
MESSREFPILDFSRYSTDFDGFSKDLFAASNEWGFFILTGHGVEGLERMRDLASQFFDLPMEEKAEKIIDRTLTGYDGKKLTTFAASEGMSFGHPAGGVLKTENLPTWWDSAKRQEVEDFKSGCYDLSIAIMSCFAVQMGRDRSYFTQFHQHKEPGNVLKLIKYPRFKERPTGVPRLSEHTDWGSITFVFTDKAGLEIRDPDDRWFDLPVVPGGVVVNIADALSLWSKKSLKSTMHRIGWNNLDVTTDRTSVVYFTHPNNGAVLTKLDKESSDEPLELTYRDYLKIRSALTYASTRDGGETGDDFEAFDETALNLVKSLRVANSGVLESHRLEVA